MNAVQAIVAAINTVVRSLPGAGNVFEVIGQHVGAFIQFLATGFQLVATAASVLIDVFRSLGQLIFGNVDLLGALSRGFERMMAVLKAVSMVLSGDEDQGGENKPPPKAPPAVRQATSQNVQSFLTKSYISAFQTGGDKDTQFKSTVSEKIIEIEKHAMSIKNDIKAFLNRVRDNANAAADAAPAAAGVAGSVAGGPVGGVVAWAATRAILSRVTGK
jgi:phage-related protein